jgi:hypothetical protein
VFPSPVQTHKNVNVDIQNYNFRDCLNGFENEVLRKIFGPKRDEVTGGWRRLHNEMGRACSTNVEEATCI